jgi:hypothetical protein
VSRMTPRLLFHGMRPIGHCRKPSFNCLSSDLSRPDGVVRARFLASRGRHRESHEGRHDRLLGSPGGTARADRRVAHVGCSQCGGSFQHTAYSSHLPPKSAGRGRLVTEVKSSRFLPRETPTKKTHRSSSTLPQKVSGHRKNKLRFRQCPIIGILLSSESGANQAQGRNSVKQHGSVEKGPRAGAFSILPINPMRAPDNGHTSQSCAPDDPERSSALK